MPKPRRYRWLIVSIFFAFMLLHQTDKLLIGPLTTDIINTFHITNTQMGAVVTGALIVEAIFYPLWGFFNDRFSRPKILALASFLWGSTTWLSAIAPTYPLFLATRSTTGVDDASYPGLYSLISDYFGPNLRGKIYGLLQLTQPIGYLLGMILGLLLSGVLGWRGVFYLTGSLGIALAFAIFFGVRDAPRGSSEPEMESVAQPTNYRFDWKTARNLIKIPSLRLLITQGFFGVFPWNVIVYWFFRYLEVERGYTDNEILVTMGIAVLVLAAGYPLGGALGDRLFKRTPRGRVIVATIGVLTGAVLLYFTMNVPPENRTLFGILLCLTAIFIPFASPNVVSTIYDITLPEVRSTATGMESFLENIGAALTPLLAGIIGDMASLHDAILWICLSAWALCTIFFIFTARIIPGDIQNLRQVMKARAEQDRKREDSLIIAEQS